MTHFRRGSVIIAVSFAVCFSLFLWAFRLLNPDSLAAQTGVSVSGSSFLLNGEPFTPEGFISVALLDTAGFSQGCSNNTTTAAANNFGDTELSNLASKWHSNTVRIHISQLVLAGPDGAKYAQHAQSDIALLRQKGFVVIVSMQDESWACGPVAPLPSQQTQDAWTTLINNTTLKNDPYIMFEIFNEPYNSTNTAASTDPTLWNWPDWQNGGRQIEPPDWPICGSNPSTCQEQWAPYTPIGHQQMINYLRGNLGVTNVIVVDGAQHGGTLAGVPILSDPGGTNQIAYAVHPLYYQDTISHWNTRFGYLVASKPVIADAWQCNYDNSGNVLTSQTTTFLNYMLTNNVGVVAYVMDWFGASAPFMTDTSLDPNACGKQFQQDYTSHFSPPQSTQTSSTTGTPAVNSTNGGRSAGVISSSTATSNQNRGKSESSAQGGQQSSNVAGSSTPTKDAAHHLAQKRVAYYISGSLAALCLLGVIGWRFFIRWKRRQYYSSPNDPDRWGTSMIHPETDGRHDDPAKHADN